MIIAFVSDAIYPYNKGGKEKRLYEISTRLAAMGHDVHIYTMHWWKNPKKLQVENGVTLHAVSKYYAMYTGDRRSISQGILFGFSCFRLISAEFDVLDVDHMPFFPLFSSWFVCAIHRKRLYATWHEALSRKDWTNYMGVAGNIAALIERISIHLPYAVTATSSHTQKLIASELKRTKRVSMVPSGVDTKQIANVKPASDKCDVLYVGRLVKDKNVDLMIRAVQIISLKNPEVKCIIVGDGIEKPHLTKLIEDLDLSNNVRLLQPLPTASDVYAYMKAARVFCLPSIREGFGIVALESLACGTAVVTTNSTANAAKDLIDNGLNGSVVTHDVTDFASALSDWIAKDKAFIISKRVSDYEWDNLSKKQLEAYLI